MASSDRRLSLYFPSTTLEEIHLVAQRRGCSTSAVVQEAWRLAKDRMRRVPSVSDFGSGPRR